MPTSKQSKSPDHPVSVVEIERAINYWRQQFPSSRDTMTLCSQAASLAEIYAQMIIFQRTAVMWSEFSHKAKEAFQGAGQSTQPAEQYMGSTPQLAGDRGIARTL
ncbi:DUF3717 domain-containing protein [Limnobacter parvus]|uniref:DUF3717 domain-containing protein n=1 Tax=Limnobacter parvus TaxID=2939690 RepID=A0ABT1XIB0_9BURK|nr:DUF3717 domain-containing protein [Limnobacter parvus]MCR2747025.1 DUF3717 domain-containing protein [Limnobacter parvus]